MRMKGQITRIAAGLAALLLALGYWLLPGMEERSVPTGGGHKKWALSDGESASWTWTPSMEGSSVLDIYLKGMKKAQEMTLTAVLTKGDGTEAASAVQPVAALGEADYMTLRGNFRTGEALTLTVSAAGEGSISIKGEEDENGAFLPSLRETGIVVSRNPVLLYFAAGSLLLALTPVAGTAGKRKREPWKWSVDRLLPWGTFLMILGVGLLVDLKKPTFFANPEWGTWDEDVHSYWVQSMALISGGGLRACLNSVITWHPGYLPLGIGYNIGEWIGQITGKADPELCYRCAVIANTAVYAAMCGLAVRHAPRFKGIFMAAGAIPLMIFQATSMTYDTAVTASVLLGAALVTETVEQPGRLSAGRAILMTALLAMGTVTKPAYSLALLSLMMIPAEKFGSAKEKWAFRIFVIGMTAWCFAAMVMPGAYEDVIGGDRRFSDTDSRGQIEGMLADPFGSGLLPVRYLFGNLYFLTSEWLDFWAYVRFGLPNLGWMYLAVLLVAAPLCCCGEEFEGANPLTPRRRIGWALIALFAELLLIYAQYIASSPVGGPIAGMQPRYFMPLWGPALLALMWPRAVRKRIRPAGDIITAATFAFICWANVQNALIHLANAPV